MAKRRPRITKPKTAREMGYTEEAIRIVDRVFREMESPFGRKESDVAREITRMIRAQGASLSFRPIVASGRNSGFVHHKPGRKVVREEEPVIFDIGAKYRGCCSDITRMHIPDSKKIKRMYSHALAMQKKVISNARAGTTFRRLHDIYAKEMKSRGYKVRHLIGHGIGREVHERVKGELEEGMIITVEPGIYIKGLGGCRVEDMVAIRKGRPKVLSRFMQPLL